MSIPILDTIITVKRLKLDSDNTKKESYVDNLALQNVKMNIQPASPEETVLVDGTWAQTSKAYTTCSGLQYGDVLTDSLTQKRYNVLGIQDWSQDGLPHYKLLITRFNGF